MRPLDRREASSLAHMRRRILAHHAAATPADLAAGVAWYDRARDAAATMLPDDPDVAAGVIAALSPRCQWATNLAWAAAMIDAARSGEDCPRVHTTAMRRVAWDIATGARTPADALNGPKVSRFYRNITGDHDAGRGDLLVPR